MTKDMVREATDDFIKHHEIIITSVSMYFEIYHKMQKGEKLDPKDYKVANKPMQPEQNKINPEIPGELDICKTCAAKKLFDESLK